MHSSSGSGRGIAHTHIRHFGRFAVGAFILVLALSSCSKSKVSKPEKIGIRGSGTRASALEGKTEVYFEVKGTPQPGLLGGKAKALPVGGEYVKVSLVKQPDGAGAGLLVRDATEMVTSFKARTNAGGTVNFKLKIGNKPGVYQVTASLLDAPDVKPRTLTVLGGVVVGGNRQDGWVEQSLDNPITVLVQGEGGKATQKALVTVEEKKVPTNTKIEKAGLSPEGAFAFKVKLGKKQGQGKVSFRIFDSPLGPEAAQYPIEARFFAIDRLKLIVNMVGALAIFIFGMKMMSEGLSLTAGEKLRTFLNVLTKNRFAAAGAGLVTTGLIQSSSACTVMVVGFVNAGLMQLEQAIGVIMGSNVGTTVTAQMISFKLDHFALPAIAVGMVVMLVAKRSRTKFLAQILLGFGFLFFGMGQLAGPLKELKDSALINQMFTGICCDPTIGHASIMTVLKAVGLGALMTVMVQSSSASIGLLLALAGVGLIDPYTGFAVLLGGNIGTTITAVLASIGANKTAKQAACAHCLFNILGTIIMVGIFFVDWPGKPGHPVFMEMVANLTNGNNIGPIVAERENVVRFLANCHTMFNVICTFMFIGFVPLFAKVCRVIIRSEDVAVESRQSSLEPHLIATPSIAIQQAWAELSYMLEEARIAHRDSFRSIARAKEIDLEEVKAGVREKEDKLDKLQNEITEYISILSQEPLNKEQGKVLPHILHSVNDAERLGDHSIGFLRLAKRVQKRKLPFTDKSKHDLDEMLATCELLFDQCQSTLQEISKGEESNDPEVIQKHLEDAYNTMKKLRKHESEFYKTHIARQEKGECDVRSGVIFLETIRTMQRSGAHIINIIEAASTIAPTG